MSEEIDHILRGRTIRDQMRARAHDLRIENGAKFLVEFRERYNEAIKPVAEDAQRSFQKVNLPAFITTRREGEDLRLTVTMEDGTACFIEFSADPESQKVEVRSDCYTAHSGILDSRMRGNTPPQQVLSLAQLDRSVIHSLLVAFAARFA